MSRTATCAIIALAVSGGFSAGAAAANDSASDDAGNANVLKLYLKMQRLEEKVRRMRGHIETLEHEIKQNRESQKKLYQNLSKQINGERSLNKTSKQSSSASGNGDNGNGQSQHAARSNEHKSPKNESGASPKTGESGSSSAHDEYMTAFNQLKNGHYKKATASFERFTQKHPDTGLTDNAYYWMGESYYVQQDYDEAKQAFEQVVNQSPKSPKVPDSLYKIALIDLQKGHTDNAKAALHRVVSQYSDSEAANRARKKLDSIGQ